MPLPLLWLGAAAVSALTIKSLADDRKSQQQKRSRYSRAQTLTQLERHDSPIATYPTELFSTETIVKPQVGAIVCCGIGGLLDHTGIWVGNGMIVELDGEGLIKPISVKRFTMERSGKQIFIACDSQANPLVSVQAAERALAQIFTSTDYHLIDNNCHQFIWQCFAPDDDNLSTFKELNLRLAKFFDRAIYWDLCDTEHSGYKVN